MTSVIRPFHSVCIDGRMLGVKATGVGRYADTLLTTLREAGLEPRVLVAERGGRGRLWRWVHAPWPLARHAPLNGAESTLSAPLELFREAQLFFDLYHRTMPVVTDAPPGVMHWTYPVPLHMEGWRNLYTVHDAIPLDRPLLTSIDPRRHRRLLAAIAKRADRLLTVSETAREDIIRALRCEPAFVVAAPEGVAPLPDQAPLPAGLTAGEYYLFCGSIEPRKNLLRLIEAHAASSVARPLVIAGPDGWRAREILARIDGCANVIRLPYQTRVSLGALMRDTRALLFPSLAEGFGLPVIEAMIAGAPVMTSAASALEETAGGAALLVDPYDCNAMAAAIAQLDEDDALTARLADAGRIRAKAFSLPVYAARLAAVHAELMEAK